jgi:sugar lactone lactonase YvrE/thiol-disulfide isomerase/thioredoxin
MPPGFVQPVHAPEIDRPGLTWFNTPAPLGLKALAGKLVILDFWTFCCINCMHIIPTLKRVEEAFPDEVVVIGVHSPKFPAERQGENVRRAIARYDIRHPVVHDPDFQLWKQYAVRAWPTLVFVGPDGHLVGQLSGEPDPDRLLDAVARTLANCKAEGLLAPAPLELAPAGQTGEGALRFPGKIKPLRTRPDEPQAWAVADAGHHQIVLFDDQGRERRRFGSGAGGFEDGPAGEACLRSPEGLIAGRDALYIADTGNHAIRRIDLETGHVSTLAGTGLRGRVIDRDQPGRRAALASPWDLALSPDEETLYIANAGTHQLLTLRLASGVLEPLAGAGPEGLRDGPGLAAHLAQPSGLVLAPDGSALWFADSETSSIRAVWLEREGHPVETLVGSGLFDFGHRNGGFADTLLQHALGLALAPDGTLMVADSYNAALRHLDPLTRTTSDWGVRFDCADSLCLPLAEPAGIWFAAGGTVLVSDTNNHRILAFDPEKTRYSTWAA